MVIPRDARDHARRSVRLLCNLVHSTVARIHVPNDIDSPAKTRARAMKQTITSPAGEER
jgi:hypothetical protein